MGALTELIAVFANSIASGATDIYNEFSLQHELGVFLRAKLPNYKVQFERNVSFFFPSKPSFTKREIDISVFSPDKSELKCAIELKFPRNGQYPEQMFSFCKDIAFTEELNSAGFSTTCLVIFAEDPLFYRGSVDGIYSHFRGQQPIHGSIQKPTGRKDSEVVVCGSYRIQWRPVFHSLMYAVVEVGDPTGIMAAPAAEVPQALAKAQAKG